MSFLEYTRPYQTFMQVLLRDPQRYFPLVRLRDNMTRNFTELTWADCEYIGAVISKENQSGFCRGIREGLVKALDADEERFTSQKMQAALTFAIKLNKNAALIRQTDIEQLHDAGWSQQSIEDLVGLVAMTKAYNTLAVGLGFKAVAEEKFAEISRATVAKHGYEPLFKSILSNSKEENKNEH